MGMNNLFTIPDRSELRAFFGSDPIEQVEEDGYFCYEATDSRGVRLRFSYDVFERSVQTELTLHDVVLVNVSHEGAVRLRIEGRSLDCDFSYAGASAKLAVKLHENIHVEWSSLRTQ
jgi:hypothetical protein